MITHITMIMEVKSPHTAFAMNPKGNIVIIRLQNLEDPTWADLDITLRRQIVF